MRILQHMTRGGAVAFMFFCGCLHAQTYSSLAYPGPDGKLDYAGYANEGQSSTGNRMIDFSHAGYQGGGVAIPWVPVALVLDPVPGEGDDHARIQTAIDSVSAMPLSPAGFRGALLLRAGTYNVSETLNINASGVVIRGEGQDVGGTVINFTATVQDNLFEFVGSQSWTKINGTETPITDALVPAGVRSFNVASTAGLAIGDRLMVHRTPNQAWIDLLDTAQWGWTTSAYRSKTPRTITAINGNTITVDARLTHAIETQYGGGEVYRYHFDGAIRQVGIERLRMESAFTGNTDENHGWSAVLFRKAENAWARQVTAKYFGFSCIDLRQGTKHATVEDCAMLDPKSIITGGRRYSFSLDDASFILLQRCYTEKGRHDYVTGSNTAGPTAFVDCLAEVTYSDIGPHHRYAEGILFDNIKGGHINVQNREDSGSGHGWAGSQIVFWNCEATTSFICDAPKAAMNFAIGCVGNRVEGYWAPEEPLGFWESRQVPVTPRSLYYKQLEDRLGTNALMTVTTPGQWNNVVWSDLSTWHGDSNAPGLPAFAPVQVETGPDAVASVRVPHELNAAVRYPLPSNFPVIMTGWTQVSGPGVSTFADATAQSTTIHFSSPGSYVLQYALSQQDDTNPANIVTYNGADTVTVEVAAIGSILNPANFTSIGSITGETGALLFNTDTLQVSGGLNATGQLGTNDDGSLVAVFPFLDIDLTTSLTISGSRPFLLMSEGDLRIATNINGIGGNGGHAAHGVGLVGAGNGGDANRSETPGNPLNGQGPGGSLGNSSGTENSTSGGGGFGGIGGSGTSGGGPAYGDQFLSSLSGGSGAGGTSNKGGGAGGGGIGLVAGDDLEITSGVTIDAQGGSGAPSGSQFTSGGGSGGGILLRGSTVTVNGNLNANGGNGGNASAGQLNGGGGSGGRVAIYYQTSLDTTGAGITVNGGLPFGTHSTGQPGATGTIYSGLDDAGFADQWLTNETGIPSPLPADWLVDYDGDGLSARLEYALGGSTSTLDSALLPELMTDGGSGFEFTFNRRQSGIDFADYLIETSTTLQPADWGVLVSDEDRTITHPTISGFERVTLAMPINVPRRFFRLRLR